MSFFGFLLKNLWRRRTRTLLTILGVAVAMATVVSLRGVAHGFERSFRHNFEHREADLLVTQTGVSDQLRSDIDERIGPKIAAIPGVRRVTAGLVEFVDMQRGESTLSAIINGWTLGGSQFDDLTMLSGRELRSGERRKIILGKILAENLKKQVGDFVEIQRYQFEIVGIYQSFTPHENGGGVVPLTELQELMLRRGSVTGFTVVLESAENKEEMLELVRSQINDLKDDEGVPYRISAQTTREYVSKALPIRLAHGMAWVTSFIALLIGAISMLNTMIMSVMERTKEIGILRAIGWRMRRVVYMVMGEAMLLSLAATGVGTMAAYGVLRFLSVHPQTSTFITGELAPIVLLEGLVMTLVVALCGGSYPAFRAARWLPSEALRHE
jgi:putative ABC transport system permease protein